MRFTLFWWILMVIILLLDIYCFQAVKAISQPYSQRIKTITYSFFWIISVGSLVVINILPYLFVRPNALQSSIYAIIVSLYLAKLIIAFFLFFDDIRRLILKLWYWFSSPNKTIIENNSGGKLLSRSLFLSWLGISLGGVLFSTFISGFRNKYNYKLKKYDVKFDNLPSQFNALKIVQISDIHVGSFHNKIKVEHGIQMVLEQKPDIIFFTGDLVNNKASEMDNWITIFSKLKAPLGVYSILGNHDYGDYVQWETPMAKKENLKKLKSIHQKLGWCLLTNSHHLLKIGGATMAIIGVENWSDKARFPKYGNLQKAYLGTDDIPFKILLTHDPSHWKGEVTSQYKNIQWTLSGHTHGMQFGVEIPQFKWSPVKYIYKEWSGWYQESNQKLYVNTGFGFIGYPGRVGILPEITVFRLVM